MQFRSIVALSFFAFASAGCAATPDDAVEQGEDGELTKRGSAIATFKSDFNETLSGSLAVGGKLRVRYSAERLPQCRTTLPGGKPGWTITGFASMNKKPPKTFYVAGFSSDPTRTTTEELAIDEAGELAVWFQVTNVHGCSQYDSDFGKNYRFAVAPSASPTTQIVFDADPARAPRASGALVAGGKVEIAYPESRLSSCRGTLAGGAPAWSITGYSSIDGEPAKPFYVAGHSADPSQVGKKPIVELTRAGRLSLWFQVASRYGCSAWDSNLGSNYTFEIAR